MPQVPIRGWDLGEHKLDILPDQKEGDSRYRG